MENALGTSPPKRFLISFGNLFKFHASTTRNRKQFHSNLRSMHASAGKSIAVKNLVPIFTSPRSDTANGLRRIVRHLKWEEMIAPRNSCHSVTPIHPVWD